MGAGVQSPVYGSGLTKGGVRLVVQKLVVRVSGSWSRKALVHSVRYRWVVQRELSTPL